MATTLKGVFYPTSSDNIAPLETHFANLANTADNVGVISSTTNFTGPATAATSVNVVVTFATAFTTAPKVVAQVQGGSSTSNYVVTIAGAPTTTGFTAKVYKIDGSTADSLSLVWYASTNA